MDSIKKGARFMKKVLIPVRDVWDYATEHGREIKRKPAIIATEDDNIRVFIHSFTDGFGVGVSKRNRRRWKEVCWKYTKDRKECEEFVRGIYSEYRLEEVSA